MTKPQIETIGESIVARLKPLADAGLHVSVLPNIPGQQGVLGKNGALALYWRDDAFDPPNRLGKTTQDGVANWMLDGRVRNLKDETGCWALRDALYGLLVGFTPTGGGKLYATAFEMVDRGDTHWQFEFKFSCPVTITGQGDEDPSDIGANLEELFFEVGTITDRWGENTGVGDLPTPT